MERAILEERQESHVDGQGDRQQQPAFCGVFRSIDEAGAIEVDECRDPNENQEPPVPPSIKEVARRQQEHILALPGTAPVEQHHEAQKDEIDRRVKEHAVIRLPVSGLRES